MLKADFLTFVENGSLHLEGPVESTICKFCFVHTWGLCRALQLPLRDTNMHSLMYVRTGNFDYYAKLKSLQSGASLYIV